MAITSQWPHPNLTHFYWDILGFHFDFTTFSLFECTILIVLFSRGKKVFRKFTDGDAASRPDVKPRLLFPSTKASKENEIFEDEEAETDIDEHAKTANVEDVGDVQTPTKTIEQKVDTPKAPKFAPASPPATSSRATRSKKVVGDEPTPVKIKGKKGGNSPFDGWRRTKNSPSASTQGQKRAGEPLATDPAPKRSKA